LARISKTLSFFAAWSLVCRMLAASNAFYLRALTGFKRKKTCLWRTGWPDWSNFSLLGDCFLWAEFWKLQT
jgi:hypothetical protein